MTYLHSGLSVLQDTVVKNCSSLYKTSKLNLKVTSSKHGLVYSHRYWADVSGPEGIVHDPGRCGDSDGEGCGWVPGSHQSAVQRVHRVRRRPDQHEVHVQDELQV